MVNAIIGWCLRNRFLMLLAVAAVLVLGGVALRRVHVDAMPDVGEKQVIVFADWPGRSPQDVDNQVTYPLTTSLAGTPLVKSIRSMSGFGFGMVFVIFKDEADYYWARSRVLERMNVAQQRLPEGVVPVLGPDATALGQIYWYTLEGEGFDLGELRSIQDWYVRYQLNAVEGVAEVASVGGYVKQYQIDVHPDKLRAHNVSLMTVLEAVRRSNIDVGAKVLEKNGVEFFIRGVGFVKSVADLEDIVLRQEGGTPIYVKNVATVSLGPDFRRGVLDRSGVEAVGGVVTMRYGENPDVVMRHVKEKLQQIERGLPQKTLPDGRVSKVRIVPFYDRTDIIREVIGTLKEALSEEAIVASLVVLAFMLHLRSTLSVLVTLPLSVALCFILMWLVGVDSNIMSLAGLAIAIGDVADMGIIMTENIYRRIATAPPGKSHFDNVYEGATEVGGAILTAVSNTIVSFIPVFFLADQEGKMFRPLAFTKTFAIGASAVLAVTVVPLVCYLLFQPTTTSKRVIRGLAAGLGALAFAVTLGVLRGVGGATGWTGLPTAAAVGVIVSLAVLRMASERFLPLEENRVSRAIARVYVPTLRWVLAHKALFMVLPCLILFSGLTVWLGAGTTLYPIGRVLNLIGQEELSAKLRRAVPGLGREFMPPLDEGSFLYMPSALPHASLSQVVAINSRQDLAIASVPEVESVVGKAGRAETALDPAPIGMMEAVVILKPEDAWRTVPVRRWFSGAPRWLKAPLLLLWPEQRRITKAEILAELRERAAIPGVLPTWLQPIQTRLVMLQTGFRAMMGVKIYGSDLRQIERIGLQMEEILGRVPGATDVVADRIVGKPYIEFRIDRQRIARYGVNVRDVQDVIETAIGGLNLTESVEGRERYPIRVRSLRDFREDLPELEKILVPTSAGAHIPLVQVVDIQSVVGPQEIKGERQLLVGYVTLNTRDRDEISVVEDAEAALQGALREGRLKLPAGTYWEWSGQFQSQQRAMKTMRVVVPATLLIMFLMLYMGFRRPWVAPIIYFGVLVSASGGFLMLWLWGANLSVAVWVGFLALFGVVDDDGVVISTYLEAVLEGRLFASVQEIRDAVLEAGLRRIRPCLMTAATTSFGLLPVFWTSGRGSDVMQPMAIPMVGGMTVSLITIFIVPCLFCAVEEWKWKRAANVVHPPGSGPSNVPGRLASVALICIGLVLPRPALAEDSLTLDGLLRALEERSPELRSRAAEVRAAKQRPAQARAFEDPMLMTELWQVPTTFDRAPIMFTLRQPIPWPGKLRARAAALEPAIDRAVAEARSTSRTLRLEAVRAYFAYRQAIRSLDVLRQNRQLLSSLLESIDVRYRVGRAEAAELLRTRAERASLDSELLDLERQRDLAVTTLNTLLDRPADAPIGTPITAPVLRPLPELTALTELALRQRPEVQAAAASLGQARAQLRAARTERAPDLAAWASFMTMLPHGADNTFSIGLQTSIPSFSLQRSDAMVREARAMGEGQQATLSQVRARVRGEVREALLRLETAERHVRLYRETLLPLGEQTVQTAQAGYQSGRVDLVLVLDAARSLFKDRQEYERSLAEYGQRLGELEAALGAPLAELPAGRGDGRKR